MFEIKGVGKDAPVENFPDGDKASITFYRCDLLPPRALLAISETLKRGQEKYGDETWRLAGEVGIRRNINHALIHLFSFLSGDSQDSHLAHAATRLLFALELYLIYGHEGGVE